MKMLYWLERARSRFPKKANPSVYDFIPNCECGRPIVTLNVVLGQRGVAVCADGHETQFAQETT